MSNPTSRQAAAVSPNAAVAGRKRSRKIFRFEEDREDPRQVKRRIREIPVPKSSLMTQEEKSLLWMQQEDHRNTLSDVLSLIQSCHQEQPTGSRTTSDAAAGGGSSTSNTKVPFLQYAEALATTFTLCDNGFPDHTISDDNNNGSDIRKSSSVANMAVWASDHIATRGVESKILPGLMEERQIRRSRAIRGVLEVQHHLRNMTYTCSTSQEEEEEEATSSDDDATNGTRPDADEVAESLAAVSQVLTHSARQFASAMAVVDGAQALMEYQAMVSSSSSSSSPQQPTQQCHQSQTQPETSSDRTRKNKNSRTSSLLDTFHAEQPLAATTEVTV